MSIINERRGERPRFPMVSALLVLNGCAFAVNGFAASDGGVPSALKPRLARLGEGCFKVPAYNAQPDSGMPNWPGGGDTRVRQGMSLVFSNADLSREFPKFVVPKIVSGQPRESTMVHFYRPAPDELAQTQKNKPLVHRGYIGRLAASPNRKIEPIEGTKLFRVVFDPASTSWSITTERPDIEHPEAQASGFIWAGNCMTYGDGAVTSCQVTVERRGWQIEIEAIEADLPLLDSLIGYFLKTLDSWKTECPQ